MRWGRRNSSPKSQWKRTWKHCATYAADVNLCDEDDEETPLHKASSYGH